MHSLLDTDNEFVYAFTVKHDGKVAVTYSYHNKPDSEEAQTYSLSKAEARELWKSLVRQGCQRYT